MPDPTARELTLIKYLNEAYGKEKQLETTLAAQIKLIQKPAIKKRLQDHLKETKAQSKGLEQRIKALGGKASKGVDLPGPDITDAAAGAVANVANRALAAAKGPVQAARGTSATDNQLRNMRDAYWNEAEEIAHYNVIEAAADQLGDKETVKLAKEFRRQEERMQAFVEKQIPALMKDVIKEEVPKEDRSPDKASSSRSSSRSSSSRSGSGRSSSGRSSSKASSSRTASRAASSNGSSKASGSKSSGSKASGTKASSSKSSSSKASGTKSSGSKSSAAKSSSSSGAGRSKSGSKSS